jgi:hypothetical protein
VETDRGTLRNLEEGPRRACTAQRRPTPSRVTAALVVHERLYKLGQSLQKHHGGGRHSEPNRDRFDLPLGDVTHLLSRVGTCVHPRPAGKP